MKKTFQRLALVSALMASSVVTVAHAQKVERLTASNWMATTHVLNRDNYAAWAEDVAKASNGTMKIEVHSAGSLIPARTTMQGVRDAVADVGIVYPPYTPSEFPLFNVLNDLVFVSSDDMAASFAMSEMGMKNPQLQAEWKKNGGVFAGAYAVPVYNFICGKKTIKDLDDAKGLKIRTAGGAQNEWVKAIGGVPVSVSSNDVYTGLERGSIDCTLSDPSNLSNYKLWEVAKSVTTLPLGVVLGADYVYNPKRWAKFTPEQRRILLDTMAMGIARSQVGYHKEVQVGLEGGKQRKMEIIEPSQALKDKLKAFNETMIKQLPQDAQKARRISDPTNLIQEYLKLEAKWSQLLANVDRNDVNAVYKVLHDNLYATIDEKSYGL
ncbi:MAG: C4-dicarboxylate TRAP transporter substrate-binding protein [Comamonas sp.]